MSIALQIPRVSNQRYWLVAGAGALALAGVLNATVFRVPQNEVAYVTRFGKVLDPASGPLQPGLHFKLPLADAVDLISVSTDTVKMPTMRAFTRDTQEVTLQVSLTYRVPPQSAYHLLYEIGRSGNVDIGVNLDAVANDRVRSIVSRRDVTELAGEGREKIIDEIKAVIASELSRLFRVDVQDVQIPVLDFSTQYKDAVNRATLARAQRVQSEQERERSRIDAETAVIKAKGEADSQYARAEGQARAQLAQARADAEGAKLRGDAEAQANKAKIEAAGGVDGYVRLVQAQAVQNWKGGVPQIIGSGSGPMPIVLPQMVPPRAE